MTVHGVPFNDLKVGGSAVEKSLTGMIKLNEREVNGEENTIPNFAAEQFYTQAIAGALNGA